MENLERQLAELQSRVQVLEGRMPDNKLSMIVFSGDLDKVMAAFIIATGAAAMGLEVVMFFTFWGTSALRDQNKNAGGKDTLSQMFGSMLPKGVNRLKLSKMNMGGLGTAMLKQLMTRKNTASMEQLLEVAEELEVRIFICEMSMDLMGFKREEMIDYKHLSYSGVATFLEEANNSRIQLFI